MLGLGRRRSDVKQLAGEREVVGLRAARRQQTVVADAVFAVSVLSTGRSRMSAMTTTCLSQPGPRPDTSHPPPLRSEAAAGGPLVRAVVDGHGGGGLRPAPILHIGGGDRRENEVGNNKHQDGAG